ncbi:MAG TPA: hypothetical protein VGK56_15520 [Anaerolineales bacterium]
MERVSYEVRRLFDQIIQREASWFRRCDDADLLGAAKRLVADAVSLGEPRERGKPFFCRVGAETKWNYSMRISMPIAVATADNVTPA